MATHLTPEQLARAVQLQRRCWTQERIAEDLGVSQSTVSRALARFNARALKRLEARIAATKARQVAQLEWMASQAAEAWERSLRDEEKLKTINTVKTVETDSGIAGVGPTVKSETFDRTETSVKGQSGNPALIREVRGALSDIRSILGLGLKEEDGESGATAADVVQEMDEAAARYELEHPDPDAEGTDQGGAEEVPGEPEPLQCDDPWEGQG